MDRATLAVTAGRPVSGPGVPLNHPVEFASALGAGGDVEYARFDARNSAALEAALGSLEGGHAVVFASGMAAITAVLEVCAPSSLARPPVVYAGTRAALDRRGFDQQVRRDWPGEADMQWLESPTNPDLRVIDIAAASTGPGLTVVDNTFATPIAQRPLEMGADIVVHSVSKYLSGHSDLILGAVLCRDASLADQLRSHREITGSIAGPMEAWLALRGLRTLDVRFRRASQNAQILASRLTEHPSVASVIWPGLPDHPDHETARRMFDVMPPVVGLMLTGGADAADALSQRVGLWVHATSLGGVESTLERRRRHRFESDEVDPALMRLSVGIENHEDLWDDLAAALSG